MDGDTRVLLKLNPQIAPTKVAVFPLVKKDGMPEIAQKLADDLRKAAIPSFYDQSGAIGRRYRRQDEVGTPWCVTIDGETAEEGTVTIRDRATSNGSGSRFQWGKASRARVSMVLAAGSSLDSSMQRWSA